MKYLGITKRFDARTALLIVVTVLVAAAAGAATDPGPVPAWIIVDDGDPGFYASSNWGIGYSSQAYGGDFRWRGTALVSDPATWTYTVPTSGTYQVYTRWVQGTNRSPQAAYTVYHSGGWTTIYVNQQTNGGRWNSLGTFSLAAGSINQVKLSCWGNPGYVVIADAVAAARVTDD